MKDPYTPAARIKSVGEAPAAMTEILRAPGLRGGSPNSWTTGAELRAAMTAARIFEASPLTITYGTITYGTFANLCADAG
jgi:hypothetical protein